MITVYLNIGTFIKETSKTQKRSYFLIINKYFKPMKLSLTFSLLLISLVHQAQTICTNNLGGDIDPAFITFKIESTPLDHNTFSGLTAFYHEYPAIGNTTAQLTAGQSYNLYTSTSSEAIIGVWLDYNNNNVFEPNEFTVLVNSMNTQNTMSLAIPATVPSGSIKMRIRSRAYGSTISANNACSSFGSGETRDYTVKIINNNLTVTEIPRDIDLKYYPNPVHNDLTISSKKSIKGYKVYDISGKLLLDKDLTEEKNIKLDFLQFPAGSYLVTLTFKDGFKTLKILKK